MLGFSCFLVFFIENHEKSLKKGKKVQKMDFAPPGGFLRDKFQILRIVVFNVCIR